MTAQEFLAAAFPEELRQPGDRVMVSWPAEFIKDGVIKSYYAQRAYHPRARGLLPEGTAWLYCVSTVAPGERQQLRRRHEDVREAFVLPCDDVGTKAKPAPIEPSYKLETSEGNFQHGYFIDPFDVSTPEGAAYYDACLLGLAMAGYNDFGCRSATRVVRLPGATHKTGFVARIVDWHPERCWDLKELMEALEVQPALDLVRARGRAKAGRHEVLEDVSDPIYQWLVKQGLVRGTRAEWVLIQCPWAHLHSHPEDDEAGYSPLDFMFAGRAFNCFHSHGGEHGNKEFLRWVTEQGGPSTDLSYERLRKLQDVYNRSHATA